MSAVPVNDDERPMGLAAFSAVRAMASMETADLHALLAAATGHLAHRGGVIGLTTTLSNIVAAARRVTEPMTLAEVAWYVAAKHNIDVSDLRAPDGTPNSRIPEVAQPRQEAYWAAWSQVRADGSRRFSKKTIGRYFGGRDHATVIYGIRAHRQRLLKEPV